MFYANPENFSCMPPTCSLEITGVYLSGRWQIVKKEGGVLSESLKAKIMITKYKIPISKVNYSAITSKKTRLHLNILTKIKLLMTGKMLF